jgi:hypothetical protein
MSNYPGLDDETAERLLDGLAVGPRRLADLLAAAAAPAFAADMVGEDAAIAEFRSSRPVPTPRHRSHRQVWARLLTVKGAALAAAFAVAGVAVAASTGVLPTPLRDPAPDEPADRWASHATVATSVPDASRTGPDVAPTTSLRGLCSAFLAQTNSHPEQVRNNPNFAKLATVAGGEEKILGFCETLIGVKTPPAHPTHPVHPSQAAHPTKSPR